MIDRIKQGADEEKTELLAHLWPSFVVVFCYAVSLNDIL